MILPMLKSLGRSIFTFFARPAPTSVALMAGPQPTLAANDDQSQMLRRAMLAATAAEDAREGEAPEGVQIFEPISIDEVDDSAAAQAAVFAPAKAMPAAAANDAVTHDALDEPAFEESVAPPIRLADWIEVEIDDHAAATAELPLQMLDAPVAEEAIEAPVIETPVIEAPVEDVASDVEAPTIEAEAFVELEAVVEAEPVVEVEPRHEDVIEVGAEEAASESVVEPPAEDAVEVAAAEMVSEEPIALAEEPAPAAAEKKPRKKRAPAKRKAAAKPRKAKIVDDVTAGPG